MSIKIYHGYRVETNDFSYISNFAEGIRKHSLNRLDTHIDELISCYGKQDIINRYHKVDDNGYLLRQTIDQLDDSLIFYSLNGYTLFQAFCSNQILRYIEQECKEAEFYGWWNNSDMDSSCNESDWDKRESDWREVLLDRDNDVPAAQGFSRVLCHKTDVFRSLFLRNN